MARDDRHVVRYLGRGHGWLSHPRRSLVTMAIEAARIGSAPFTVADLEGMPDDGRFYELSNGALVVTPGPDLRHQSVVSNLHVLLANELPPTRRVLAEAELYLRDDMVKRPDLMVVDADAIHGQRYRRTPHLVVEVRSPSTAIFDRTEKRIAYAEAGIPAYWLVDPDGETITVLELDGDEYRERATIARGEQLDVTAPVPFTVVADDVFR